MDGAMFISKEELVELTGRKIRSKQIDALRRMGVPFFVNACGRAVVARSVIEGRTGAVSRDERGGRPSWSPAILGG